MARSHDSDNRRLSDADKQKLAAVTIVNASRIGAEPPRREFLQALAAGILGAIAGKGVR